ncbi:carboxyvinyl-carboxyphosphonate phosphorylmutase [Acuticoccus sediminis]|uniref:Carboxyvinyl-carboxyphosphonate phosphorylmutase n=1 Tax=Acuticoccus sediminis TaxID=2184697 RepID=A0A8B2NTE6_9HYPH|nr:isocitrate lyase/PEP mutase family protein [Acuticoccus sediminis]RAI02221.1 carboxyvinyl-carboxyphosphonate phosphorylmutase [Acuticoccus sediminis]
MKPTQRLRALLAGDEILVSPGVYDGYSVRLVEKMGFKTACTTGAGLANARMGFEDVGIMGLTDNLDACRMIAGCVSIPVMADADTGYGNPATVWHTTRRFEDAGVAGINIEDQVSPKRCGHMAGKDVIDMREMAKKIEAACNARRDDDFVILARTDAIAVEGLEGALRRARLYEKAGADLIFADAIKGEEQIKALVDAVDIPVSVNMGFGLRSRPTTPLIPIKRLAELGVRRVTLPRMLPAAALKAMETVLALLKETIPTGDVVDRPDLLASIDDIWGLMGFEEFKALEAEFNDIESVDTTVAG